MSDQELQTIHGEPSYRLASDKVTLFVTKRGGHMAPVEFDLGEEHKVSPYSLSPWKPGEIDPDFPVLLKVLRGDFFCLPFGPTTIGPPHGDTANAEWSFEESDGGSSLKLSMEPSDVGGRVEKIVSLEPGQTAIYQEHRVSGVEGSFSYGHHPIIHCGEVQGRVSTSAFDFGSVNEGLFSDPESREYQSLKPGARFSDLREVPMINGEAADLTHYPARRGFEDLVMMASSKDLKLGWSAVVLDGYAWFSLKSPAVFPSNLFWISNGGRHAAPWNGVHVNRIGFEDVCSFFAHGLEVSREDRLKEEGVPTSMVFSKAETKVLRTIQAVTAVGDDFGAVARIEEREGAQSVKLVGSGGEEVEVAVDWEFVLP